MMRERKKIQALQRREKRVSLPMPPRAEVNALIALFNAKRYAEQESRARLLVDRYPDFGFGWKLLGGSLQMQGKNALPAFQRTAELMPDEADAHYNLGVALKSSGLLADSAASYRRAVAIKPDYAEAHSNLGNVLKDLGQLNEAVVSYRHAVALKPDFAMTHYNLGNVLKDLGQLDDAMSSYRRVVALKPDFAEAHNDLATVMKGVVQHESSLEICRREAARNPGSAEAHFKVGVALHDLGQFDDAVASYRRALEFKPDSAEVHYNVGTALEYLQQTDEALESYRRAVEIEPNLAEAHNNIANILRQLGKLYGAEASYRRVLEIKPDHTIATVAYSNLLYTYAFTRHVSPELERDLAANWENTALNESERTAAHFRTLLFDNSPRAGRKLRIGVVSAELGQHPVAYFLEPFLEQLDRSRFHITLYPTTIRLEPRAERFNKLGDEFKPLVGIPDNKAADLIRADRIDILIDTTGHMTGSRLGIFAHRAAPVQCHYIGYHGTTGLTEMDWFIADADLLPSSCEEHFRESIWRLPRLRMSYKGDTSFPGSNWKPNPEGTVWLGSFNNLTKVREEALGLWAKVMNAIPRSKLFLKDRQAANDSVQERIRAELFRHGICAERIEFAGDVPDYASHMALYDRLDIALDTIPLNGETTAFDALWMGVPLVALEGDWYGARMSSAMLRSLGKPEWVAKNEDEYVAIVAALAQDVDRRRSLRASQRAMMERSPLCDAKGLTRALEDAFGAMFDRWVERRGSVVGREATIFLRKFT